MADLPARLVFGRTASDGLPARLVFGTQGEDGERVTLHASARLSGLRGRMRGRVGVVLQGSARLSGIRGRLAGVYDVNVERPLVVQVHQGGQAAQRVALPGADAWQDARQAHAHIQQHAQQARQAAGLAASHWQDAYALRVAVQQHAQQAVRLVTVADQSFEDAVALRLAVQQHAQQAQRQVLLASAAFEDAHALLVAVQARQQQAARMQILARHAGGAARALGFHHAERTQQAVRPGPGLRPIVPPQPPKPCHPDLPALLAFSKLQGNPLPARLVFFCRDGGGPQLPPAKIVVPIRKAYIVLNEITLHRIDNGAPLRALNFSMQLDFQSWTWSWSAELHESAKPHLGRGADGYPAVLEVSINSVPVRLRLGPPVISQPFLPTRIRVGGKGLAEVLGDPWAPEQTFGNAVARTARQLMDDVLTVNGVPLGWTVDWGIDDWLVPGDTWSVQGRYIDAIQDIANAVGAYVQPHNTAATLRILPEYPVAPWHWADVTPDYELPAGVAEVVDRELVIKPQHNAVWISGMTTGSVGGPFGRQGTAKDVYAPQVVHSLMTDATAHRQRGLAVISATGRPEMVTISTPVLPEAGLILPGKFVRFAGATGLVRGISVQWQRPGLRQQVLMETHPNA